MAVGLVGSYARNAAKSDSDMDMMILVENPEVYIHDESWISQFGEVEKIENETWSQLKTKRVFYKNIGEVEFNFDKKSWATKRPIDAGTKRVVSDGMVILVDKQEILSQLQREIN